MKKLHSTLFIACISMGPAFAQLETTTVGNVNIEGKIFYPNAPETSDYSNLIFYDPVSNALTRGDAEKVANLFYNLPCLASPEGGAPLLPYWNNGPSKLFVACPENIRVGIGTSDPTQKLDVRGKGFFSDGIRIGNITPSTSILLPAMIEVEANTGYTTTPFIRMSIKESAGATETRFRVDKSGEVYCTSLRVRLGADIPVPDYVFADDYQLMPLDELKNYISLNAHLPRVPSENDIRKDGLQMEHMQLRLLEKIEELTLYLLKQEERISQLEKQLKP